MKRNLIFSSIVIGTYLLLNYGMRQLPRPEEFWTRFSIFNVLPIFIIFIVSYFIHRGKITVGESLGVNKAFLPAFKKAFIMTLPMMLGYGLLANFNITISMKSLFIGCIWAAFSEEITYRAFLFGQLFRFGKWPFLAAAVLNGLIFGIGHLYQAGGDYISAITIFMTTAIGGIWFAWMYIEWNNNIWIPMCLHFLMNLWWSAFDAGENAAGGVYANIFRGATIAISIYWTIKQKKERQLASTENNVIETI